MVEFAGQRTLIPDYLIAGHTRNALSHPPPPFTVSGPETKLFMEANGFLTTVHDDIGPAHCILAVCMHSSLSFIRHAPTASNLNINVYLNLYVHVCRLVCFYMCLSVAVCVLPCILGMPLNPDCGILSVLD